MDKLRFRFALGNPFVVFKTERALCAVSVIVSMRHVYVVNIHNIHLGLYVFGIH